MNDFLISADIKDYLQLSRQLGKIVVVTGRCGSGKSTATSQYVCENPHEAPRLVVEKISSCDKLKADLIRLNPKLKDLIGVYHSNSETSDDITELYEKSKSKPISIVTHARLNIDSAQRWMFTNSVIAPYCQSIIIDEMPNDQVFTVNIMIETLLDKTRRLNPELAVLMERILFRKQNPIEVHTILSTLVSVEPCLRDYVSKLVKYNTRLADAGIITESSSNNLLINLEKNYIKRKP